MFLETTTLVSIGTTIRVLAPLSDENPQPIRTKATVLYHNRRGTAGAGANPSARVKWTRPVTEPLTREKVLGDWNPKAPIKALLSVF